MKRTVPKGDLKSQALNLLASERAAFVRSAMRVARCRRAAEDIVQDATLKICENGIDAAVQNLRSYLHRIVYNLAIDATRRLCREQCAFAPDDCLAQTPAPCACPHAALEHRQALDAIMLALDDLPARTRCAFVSHRIGGVSQREIAANLKVSPTLVNFMIRDAHRYCFQKLNAHETGDASLSLSERPPGGPLKKKPRKIAALVRDGAGRTPVAITDTRP